MSTLRYKSQALFKCLRLQGEHSRMQRLLSKIGIFDNFNPFESTHLNNHE